MGDCAQIRLSIELGSDPIRGSVHVPSEASARDFDGWIELTEVIEAVRASASGSRVRELDGDAPTLG